MNPAILDHLALLYPDATGRIATALESILAEFAARYPAPPARDPIFSERDAVLICYGDHVQADGERPLRTMHRFLREYVRGLIPTVHFLPFFPYSSDDGFSVIDYTAVAPSLGDWNDISAIATDFDLMVDLVINHVSAQSAWFQAFLAGDEAHRDYFIAFEEPVDVSSVFRPRTHPLLSPFETAHGTRHVWTTFSDDQIDLNVSNPAVLLELIRILLLYVSHGAAIVRLDAIAFLWKRLGTTCVHLPETHAVVQLLRAVLEEVAPHVLLITETNVPHEDNISYFGAGNDEAHLVYNFALPPLLLYSIMRGDASLLSAWARTLDPPSARTAFFNFTASHDGIGVTALRAMVSPEEVEEVVQWVRKRGGRVNYRAVPDAEPVPYELNVVYLDAAGGVEPFLVSQAIALALRGMPAIYLNSLIGARNWHAGVESLGYNRAINREKFEYHALRTALSTPSSQQRQVYEAYARLLAVRRSEPLFSPLVPQTVLDVDHRLFALLRSDGNETLLALHNVSADEVRVSGAVLRAYLDDQEPVDLLGGASIPLAGNVRIDPFGILWVK